MSTEADKLKSALNKNALTDRLRRAATVSDAGPGDRNRLDEPHPDEQAKTDHEIILELNSAIQDIMSEAPLSRPNGTQVVPPGMVDAPPAAPAPGYPVAHAQTAAYPGYDGHPQTTMPAQNYLPVPAPGMNGRDEDDGRLRNWLTRSPEDQSSPRSRTRTIALCAGVMFLSILAGYGSAQMLNSYRSSENHENDTWIKTVAGNWNLDRSEGTGDAGSASESEAPEASQAQAAQEDTPEDTGGIERVVKRVTTQPVEVAADTGQPATPYRVASISDFAGAVPEPQAVRTVPAVPSAAPDEPAPDATSTVPSAPETPQTSIPGDDQERLFKRALQLIDDRDIAAARLMLRHLAEAGSGPAALKLAQTYDAEWLAGQDAVSVPPNNDMALRWYSMARDRGEAGTEDRIEALSQTVRASN
ncbi:MAG: hypothetical protein ACR2O4_05765 [Hyphomicrobiaceae bacterium]